MASERFKALEAALIEAGAPAHWARTVRGVALGGNGAVNALVNANVSAKPYVDLLLDALPELHATEQEMVVRALSEGRMPKAGPVLTAMMRALANASPAPTLAWAIGNALAAIQDPATLDDVLILCADRRLGISRQMLFTLLPCVGSDRAYQAALDGLDDDGVRGHALEALGRFGRLDALERIRALPTKKGLYESKAKAAAIRRLERAEARRAANA